MFLEKEQVIIYKHLRIIKFPFSFLLILNLKINNYYNTLHLLFSYCLKKIKFYTKTINTHQ